MRVLSAMAFDLACPAAVGAEEAPDLVARLRTGETRALGEAYDLYHAYVRAFARRLVGDDAIAEDVVQETFVALPRAARRYLGEAALRTFIVGIAVNQARHYVRAAARRRAAAARLASEPMLASRSPESDAQATQLADALTTALDDLSVDQRVAFVLCELEGQGSVEAALILSVPEATVRTRLFNAKRNLRAWFARKGMR